MESYPITERYARSRRIAPGATTSGKVDVSTLIWEWQSVNKKNSLQLCELQPLTSRSRLRVREDEFNENSRRERSKEREEEREEEKETV